MEPSQTKLCTKCGKELPLEMFGKGNGKDGKRSWCKTCMNEATREYIKRKKISNVPNPALAEFTPQELISELRARGYAGTLTFTEVKVHKIKA